MVVEESNSHVRLNGSVMEGHVVLTRAGNLPCKRIIHAVGPQWRGGRFGEENILYDCVFSHILKIANQENLSTVAIPAISAGVFGFPIKVSTSVIIEAIKDFLEDLDTGNISLSEIHLLDNRKAGGQAFVDAMSKRFKTKKSSKSKNPSSFPKPIGKHITADNEILGR